MFLKINMFKKLIKAAWKGIGLTVGNDGEEIYLVGNHWTIWLASWEMTNKAKAAIIELTGGLLVKRGMHFEGYGKSNRRRPKRYLYAGSDGDVGFLRRKKKEDK